MKNFIVFIISLSSCLYSQQSLLFKMDNLRKKELKSRAFELSFDQKIQLNFIAPIKKNDEPYCAIWIINLDDKETVWELYRQEPIERLDKYNHKFDEKIDLKKGRYEVYISTFGNNYNINIDSFGDFLDRLFDGDFNSSVRSKFIKRIELSLYANGKLIADYQTKSENSIIDLTEMRKNEHQQIALELTKECKVEIYSVGEILRDGSYDHASVRNLKTRDIIWDMNFRNTEHAGGGEKNRYKRDIITLEKGKYLFEYVSDDSHYFDNWNVSPPHNPRSWGLTVKLLNISDKQYFKSIDYTENFEQNVIISIDRAGDNFYEKQTFEVLEDIEIHIFALGEGTKYSGMVDYAWIDDLNRNKKIWEMDYDETEHAGGATKNRKVDRSIKLSKGLYNICYVTDDSHSYHGGFNSTTPNYPKKWGVTLYSPDDKKMKNKIKKLDKDYKNKNVIVEITRVGDHDKIYRKFTLDKDQLVRIYALGEGDDDDMHDYGWIKNVSTGRTIWKMRYEDTQHAGGARKNRVVDETIKLQAGDYELCYRSDGSHSFEDWNDRAPRDRELWGITVYKVD
jgi:hypothetical protein